MQGPLGSSQALNQAGRAVGGWRGTHGGRLAKLFAYLSSFKVRAHSPAMTKSHLHFPRGGNEVENDPKQGRATLMFLSDVGTQRTVRGGDPETPGGAWAPGGSLTLCKGNANINLPHSKAMGYQGILREEV